VKRIPGARKRVQVAIRDMREDEHRLMEESGRRVQAFFDTPLQQKRFDGVHWNRQVDAAEDGALCKVGQHAPPACALGRAEDVHFAGAFEEAGPIEPRGALTLFVGGRRR
jgi:hypothetical protein